MDTERGWTMPQWCARQQMWQEVKFPSDNFLKTRLHNIF